MRVNPNFLAILAVLMFCTVMLFIAGITWWWAGLVVLVLYVAWAVT